MKLASVLAQNSTVQPSGRVSRLQCPSGFHCFNNSAQTVTIEWGHNGYICDGQTAQECYGESDPLGFERGPRQHPQTVIQGDKVIFKPISVTFNVRNVSKDAYDKCTLSGQLVHNKTSSAFEVPSKYLNSPGIKYFISEFDDNLLYSCLFGLKLELYVRNRQQPNCINPATPRLGVCSGAGLCSSDASTFFIRNYSCLCFSGYHGKYCEELDSCDSSRNPCKNGATCRDITDGLTDSFNCTCPPGYDGILCGNNINECASSPCQNGGFCVDYVNYYSCLCPSDFECDNCECIIPDPCISKPCANGGTCQRSGEKRKNYTCTCLPNFTGRNCTVNVTSLSFQFSSTLNFQTSILLSTSSLRNSSFASPGVSSSLISLTRGVTSSAPTFQMSISTTPQLESSPITLQRSSSKTTSIQQSTSVSMFTYLASTTTSSTELLSTPMKVQTTFSSSVPVVSSSFAKSLVSTSTTAVRSIFSQTSSALITSRSSSGLGLAETTGSGMKSLSTSSLTDPLTSSYVISISSAMPSPSSLSFLSSFPTVRSTFGQTSITSFGLPYSTTALTSLAITSSPLLTEPASSTRTTTESTLSTVFYSSTITVLPSRTTVVISSSVAPTLPPSPTTPPLRNQTCIHNPCNNGTCVDEPYLGYEFRCECSYPTVGPLCTSIKGKCHPGSRGLYIMLLCFSVKILAFFYIHNTINNNCL